MSKLYVILLDNNIPVMDIDPNSDYESPHVYTHEEAETWIAANPTTAPHFYNIVPVEYWK